MSKDSASKNVIYRHIFGTGSRNPTKAPVPVPLINSELCYRNKNLVALIEILAFSGHLYTSYMSPKSRYR
jgi:hypothetical protein